MNTIVHDSPVGPLTLTSDEGKLVLVEFERRKDFDPSKPQARSLAAQRRSSAVRDAVLDSARKQLDAYFTGRLKSFDLPLAPRGTDFQRSVWKALTKIPYGATTSYGAIAREVGEPSAARAVGAANGANPICIIIPCHRVIGANGSLTGFGGGLDRKRFLLNLESDEGLLFDDSLSAESRRTGRENRLMRGAAQRQA